MDVEYAEDGITTQMRDRFKVILSKSWPGFFFYRSLQADPKIQMEIKGSEVKIIFKEKNRVGGLSLSNFQTC